MRTMYVFMSVSVYRLRDKFSLLVYCKKLKVYECVLSACLLTCCHSLVVCSLQLETLLKDIRHNLDIDQKSTVS